MAHLMGNGKECGLPDGHKGSHYSAEAYRNIRAGWREKYYRTLAPEHAARLRAKYERGDDAAA